MDTHEVARPMRIIRKPALAEKLGLAITSLDDLRRNDPTFPKGVFLGARSIGFFEHEVDAWLEARPRVIADPALEVATA